MSRENLPLPGMPVSDALKAFWDFGKFEVGTSAPNTNISLDRVTSTGGAIATAITDNPHGLIVGQKIAIRNDAGQHSGYYTVASVPSSTTFTYIMRDVSNSLQANGFVDDIDAFRFTCPDLSGNGHHMRFNVGHAEWPGPGKIASKTTMEPNIKAAEKVSGLICDPSWTNLAQPYSVTIAQQILSLQVGTLFDGDPIVAGPTLSYFSVFGGLFIGAGVTSFFVDTIIAGMLRCYTFVVDGAATKVYKGGIATATTGNPGTAPLRRPLIAAKFDGDSGGCEHFCFYAIHDKALSAGEARAMAEYSALTWGTPLD